MHRQPPHTLDAIEESTLGRQAKRTADKLAEQLWAEHGWDLTGLDVAGLLIGVLVASIFLTP